MLAATQDFVGEAKPHRAFGQIPLLTRWNGLEKFSVGGQLEPRKWRIVSINFPTEIGFDR